MFYFGPPITENGIIGLVMVGGDNEAVPLAIIQSQHHLGCDYDLLGGVDGTIKPKIRKKIASRLKLKVDPSGGNPSIEALVFGLLSLGSPDGDGIARPLMPTREGYYEAHIGNRTFRRRFRGDRDQAWSRVQAIVRNGYRKARLDSIELARKYGTATARKMGITFEHVRPDEFAGDGPLRPATTIVDDFDRADQNNLGTSSEGWSWATSWSSGVFDIVSNEAKKTGSSWQQYVYANSPMSSADHYAEAYRTSGGNGGVTARGESANRAGYWIRAENNGCRLYMWNSGHTSAGTSLQTKQLYVDTTGNTPRLYRVDANGSTITGYYSNLNVRTPLNALPSVTDTTHATGLYGALTHWNSDTMTWADFLADDGIVSGGGALPLINGGLIG